MINKLSNEEYDDANLEFQEWVANKFEVVSELDHLDFRRLARSESKEGVTMSFIEVPEELRSLRDAVVAYAQGKRKTCPDLEPLQEWFENGDGWDHVVMSVEGGAVCLESVAETYFSNSMLRDYVDVPPKVRITKAQKLAYARERLEYDFSQTDDSLHRVKISNDPDTYLACFIFGQGQGGWDVEWLGLFKSTDELTRLDEGCNGYFICSEDISDEKILSMWW